MLLGGRLKVLPMVGWVSTAVVLWMSLMGIGYSASRFRGRSYSRAPPTFIKAMAAAHELQAERLG